MIRPLGGGNRNTVLEIRLAGRLAARKSRRGPASLDW